MGCFEMSEEKIRHFVTWWSTQLELLMWSGDLTKAEVEMQANIALAWAQDELQSLEYQAIARK
jgi:hypothetical protein